MSTWEELRALAGETRPTSEVLAKALREVESDNPAGAVALGFTPLGVASDAAALRDPDAPMWEKALSLLGPAGDVAKPLAGIIAGAAGAARTGKPLQDTLRGARVDVEDPRLLDLDWKETVKDPEGYPDLSFGDLYDTSHSDTAEALRAYPALQDLRFTIKGSPKGGGHFNPSNWEVYAQGNPRQIQNTLSHEVQHAVQAIEDYPSALRGANAENLNMRSPFNEWIDNYFANPGEMEARLNSLRHVEMSPAQRQRLPLAEQTQTHADAMRKFRNMGDWLESIKDYEQREVVENLLRD